MKKRIVAFLMCTVMVLAGLPVSPLADYVPFAFEALAAEAEPGRVEISPNPLYVYTGKMGSLVASVYDTEGNSFSGEVTYQWSSSDKSVATFRPDTDTKQKAEIVGLSKGTAEITVTASCGGVEKTDTCKVTVKPSIEAIDFVGDYKLITLPSTGEQLSYTVSPSDAGNKNLTWTVSDDSVCTVDGSGFVTPKAPGVCVVTATAQDGSNIEGSVQVIVSDGTSKVILDKDSIALRVGEGTEKLTATCTLHDVITYYDAVEWTTSDPSVAIVDRKGVVTPVGRGQALITATALDGSGNKAHCSVVVAQPVEGITVDESAVCYVGETCTLIHKITPSNASDTAVTWTSSDESIATVDSRGIVKGIKVGTVIITVKTADGGHTAESTVKVEIKPESVNIPEEKITLTVTEFGVGSTIALAPIVSPDNATNKDVIWSSDNESVATVDENGIVKAVAGGTAVITATTVAGGYKDTCIVNVEQDEKAVEISDAPDNFYVGRTHTLEAIFLPSTATDKRVTWKSSDESVVTVSSSGVLEAKKAGTATITVTTANMGKTATLKVTVIPKVSVSKITLNMDKVSIERTSNEKLYLFETIIPSNASDKTVKWASSNTTVATVDSNGVVTPRSAGQTRITATAKDGSGASASCMVTVVEPVTGISLDKKAATILLNETVKLTATVKPSDASNKTVKWSTSKSSVATVSSSGLVTAKGGGTAIITAKTADGEYDVSCTVTVISHVTGVKINSGNLNVPLGEKRTLTASVLPADASNKTIIWKSSNESVATVSSSGTVKGMKTGTAEISAVSQDGGYKAVIDVTVIRPATSVTLTFSSITLNAGKKKTLEATVKPLAATYKTVKWKSSNKKVAKVSSKGVVTAVAAGTATITCTSTDGYASAKCKVTVTQPTTGIKASSSKVSVKIGTPKTLKVTVTPSDASNKNVVWTSADTKIATVDEKGVVKGLKKGKVKITARTADGLYSTEITVTVKKPVKSVSVNKTSLTINVGKTSVLKATVKPSSASNKSVTWSSSNNDVAKVSSEGKITAKAPGYAVITCTTKDGKKKAECSVLVKQPVKSVKLSKTKATLDMKKTLKLKATVKPKDASNSAVKWSSSNEKIAKVSSKGVVTPIKPGKVTITVTTKDGGYKATCTVKVVRKLKSISVPEEKTVFLGETEKIRVTFTPSNATNKDLEWKSSKKSVATVSSKGVVTPKKLGKTTITVVSDDGDYKATCKVTVKSALKSVKINKTKLTLNAGKTYSLKITKKPKNATEDIIWTTSKRSVAVVNQEGRITAVGRGTATITGITEHGDKVTCKVTVKQPVTSMKISKKTATLYMGETLTLTAGVLPSNANNKSFKWSTSDKSVATVKDGKVTPKKLGKVKITATSENGKKATCTVTVKRHVSSVSLNKSSVSIVRGKTFTLVPTVKPSDASDKTCTYKSSKTSVATVSSDGIITAKAVGTATITVTTKEGKKTATCKVTVTEKVTGVKISSTSKSLYIGDTATLKATVSPSDATNKAVTWSTSNSAVATVKNGVVTAVGAGEAKITVKTVDGSYKAVCTVKVSSEPVKFIVNSIAYGDGAIYLEIDPSNWNGSFVSASQEIPVKVNGEVVGNAICTVPSAKTGDNYEIKINISPVNIPSGSTVEFTIPEGIVKNESGSQHNLSYSSSVIVE